MKNNKKTLFFLVPASIIVWALIVWQIVSGINNNKEIPDNYIVKKSEIKTLNDTLEYKLILNYEDPFNLSNKKRISIKSNTLLNRKSKTKKFNKPKKVEQQWPIIQYGGLVKSSNKRTIGLIKLNDKSYLIKVGDMIKGVEIIDYTEGYIKIKLKNETKTFYK